MHINKFTAAAALAIIYVVLAAGFVWADRRNPSHGSFISVQGMMSSLVTLPVAFPLEYWGHAIDFRNNWQMGAAITICGGLVMAVSFGALCLGEFIWVSTPIQG